MFTAEHRDHVRHRILELARTDPRVTAGALTGSTAFGAGDDWSDIDVAFGIADGITSEDVLHDWTQVLDRESAHERLKARNTTVGQVKDKIRRFGNLFNLNR